MYSTDLARIRKQLKDAALDRFGARPASKRKAVPRGDDETLRRDLEEELSLVDQAVELAIL